MKTIDVKKLVTEVLASLPQPYSEDIIDEVFFAIEINDRLFRRYSECCADIGRVKVNTAGANWVRKELGRPTSREAPAKLSKLIGTYSVLDNKAPVVRKKPVLNKPKRVTTTAKKRAEAEARKLLSDYYQANRASLSPQIGLYREQILKLLRSGVPVAAAFEQAFDEDTAESSL